MRTFTAADAELARDYITRRLKELGYDVKRCDVIVHLGVTLETDDGGRKVHSISSMLDDTPEKFARSVVRSVTNGIP